MSRSLLDFLNIFVESPGDLLFFLLVIAISQVALFLAFGQRARSPHDQSSQRYTQASIAQVGIWILVFVAALVSLNSNVEPIQLMPPLERLAQTLTVTILAWAFLSAGVVDWRRRSNVFLLGTVAVVVLIYFYTAYEWYLTFEEGATFNSSVLAPVWSVLPAAIALTGLLIALINFALIVDAPLKGVFFLLILIGNGWDLLQFLQGEVTGSYLGSARLAYLGATLLLPLILYRFVIARLETRVAEVDMGGSQTPSVGAATGSVDAEREADSADKILSTSSDLDILPSATGGISETLLGAFGQMMDTRGNSSIPQQVVRATIDALGVEICVLLRIHEKTYADVIAGYDSVADLTVPGISLNLAEQPTLQGSIDRGEQVTLDRAGHHEELDALFRRLSIKGMGNVYLQPVSRHDEILAVLLASMPYRDGELSQDNTELLGDLAVIAGHILAWSFESEASAFLAEEMALHAIIDGESTPDLLQAEIASANREMEASLEKVAERSARLDLQKSDLRKQLHEERIRLLDLLGENQDNVAVAQKMTIVFDELAILNDSCDECGNELLDLETVLRLLNENDEIDLERVVREYVQKAYSLQLNSRDRLQRQIADLKSKGQSIIDKDPAGLVESLSNESAQLESEREQLQNRIAAIMSKLDSLGIVAELSSMTHILVQLYADRKTMKRHAASLQRTRDLLLHERSQLAREKGTDGDDLQLQLEQVTADHAALMNLREEMRRDYQELLTSFEARGREKSDLRARNEDLRSQLNANAAKQNELNQAIWDLSEERDNLLQIRDQLTARIAESLADSSDPSGVPELRAEIAEMRNTVAELTEHRGQLELELSEANSGAAVEHAKVEAAADMDHTSKDTLVSDPDMFRHLVRDLQSPMTAIADATDILLAESIGILGAAQLQVLRHVAANIEQLADMLGELSQLAWPSGDVFRLEYSQGDIVMLLDEALAYHSQILRQKELVVDLSLHDLLPPITMDARCIKQILNQLISNACGVSDSGSQIFLTIETDLLDLPGATGTRDAVHIRVGNSGQGIAPEDIPRVFARKYRSENPRIKGLSDTGVGMIVAREYARAHGGDLWLASEPGNGSTFHLALPITLSPTIED